MTFNFIGGKIHIIVFLFKIVVAFKNVFSKSVCFIKDHFFLIVGRFNRVFIDRYIFLVNVLCRYSKIKSKPIDCHHLQLIKNYDKLIAYHPDVLF